MLDLRTPYVMRRKGSERIGLVAIQMCIKDGKLCFYDYDRGHMLQGKLLKERRDGGIEWKHTHKPLNRDSDVYIFTPMTMDDFDIQLRPYIPEELSRILQDLDDVYVWYRKQAGIV